MVAPDEFSVFVNVYRDVTALRYCLRWLREVYPTVAVTVISDGSPDEQKARETAEQYNCRYHAGEHLLAAEHGLAWWDRAFRLTLQTGADYHLKVDTDTRFWRPFNSLPEAGYFGDIKNAWRPTEHVQGGLQGFSAEVIDVLLESGYLDNPIYKDPHLFAPNEKMAEHFTRNYQVSTDHSIQHVCDSLGIFPVQWDEVHCEWMDPPTNRDKRYAVTHPSWPKRELED